MSTLTFIAALTLFACGDKDQDSGGIDNTDWDGGADGGAGDGGSGDGGSGDGGSGDGGSGDGGSGDGGSGDGGSGDGGSGDGGSGGKGLLTFSGNATVAGPSFDGTETLVFKGDDGDGDVLCEITIGLEATGRRDDCASCDWAYDLVVTASDVTTNTHCDAIGYDKAALAALVGSTRSYGFDPLYFGHAPTLMVSTGKGVWNPTAYASYDDKTGAFFYEGVDGAYPY